MIRAPGGSRFETERDVAAYVEATAGLDARREIATLRDLIGDGARVLELGSGGGVDLERLARHFDVIGSDPSAAARRCIRRRAGSPPVIDLRAEDLAALPDVIASSGLDDRRWAHLLDAIFSSRVLHLLDSDAHDRCLAAQARLLAPTGVAMHLVWAPLPSTGPSTGCEEAARLDADALRRRWLDHFHDVEVTPRSELAHHDLLRVTARGPRLAGPADGRPRSADRDDAAVDRDGDAVHVRPRP